MIDLHRGTTLIEASAGTGKTYTLCRIALQLTLQEGITLDRILAVTFTEAATEELASRIQKLYQQCLRELETGEVTEQTLADCRKLDGFDETQAINALRYSLEVFDEAPISTIHGFCKRALELVALETQTPLDAELNQVESELIERLRQEYIRQNILEKSTALSLAYATQKDFEHRLASIGRQTSSHPEAKLHPTPTPISLDSLEQRLSELPEAFKDLLGRRDSFAPHLAKNREPYKQLFGVKDELCNCVRRGQLLPQDFVWIQKLDTSAWKTGIKKSGENLPVPSAITLIDTLLDQIDQAFQSLAYNYKAWLAKRLERAKILANSISFNDLLHLLQRALSGPAGESVRTFLGSRYDAALIDEFQDTDRTQLQIARQLFGSGEHYLFYIGDPKQAIYRFRGADIYAYFQAVEGGAIKKVELDTNYRSTPKLVDAVNLIFEEAKAQFVDDRIVFRSVNAGVDAPDQAMALAPFRILQARNEGPKPESKGKYQAWIARRAANDLAERLNRDPEFAASDVVYLVNDRFEAARLSDALYESGIASVIRADRSIFKTIEAATLRQLLASLSSPAKASLKRGVFCALNESVSAAELAGSSLEDRLTPFFDYISQWAKEWFDRNFDASLKGLYELAAEVKDSPHDAGDERKYANLLQLSEILSEAREAEELSPRGLYNWLCRKTDADVANKEEWQTRISSDEGKPQILTIHKSKGLQFPIVVLPFIGLKRMRLGEATSTFHREDELIIDYAPDPESEYARLSQREALAEDIRLFYVALTRAERETHLYLCPEEMKKGPTPLDQSSFAQFLLGDEDKVSTESVGQFLKSIAEKSNGCIDFDSCGMGFQEVLRLELPKDSNQVDPVFPQRLQSRNHLPYSSRVLSFSALNRSLHKNDTALSLDEPEEDSATAEDETTGEEQADIIAEAEVQAEDSGLSIFTLPKGRHAGDLLHLILERYDFSNPSTLGNTTQQAFDTLQFEPREFEPIVAAQVDSIATIALQSQFDRFTLRETDPQSRVPELEFAFTVNGDTKQSLLNVLNKQDLGRIPISWRQNFSDTDGILPASMLRGFIDLVLEQNGRFYIFDWKSNYLGPEPSDYDQASIEESMSEHNYFLQYLLYCIALKRFIRWRYPNSNFMEHFGGVFYIYARGITPGKETGIYYDLPSEELLDAIDYALIVGGVGQ